MLDLPSPIYQLVELIKAGADPDYAPRVENISHDTLLASAHNQRLMPLLRVRVRRCRVARRLLLMGCATCLSL